MRGVSFKNPRRCALIENRRAHNFVLQVLAVLFHQTWQVHRARTLRLSTNTRSRLYHYCPEKIARCDRCSDRRKFPDGPIRCDSTCPLRHWVKTGSGNTRCQLMPSSERRDADLLRLVVISARVKHEQFALMFDDRRRFDAVWFSQSNSGSRIEPILSEFHLSRAKSELSGALATPIFWIL